MVTDVLIIGAGIFGCVVGKALQNKGLDVMFIDAERQNAGSRPAACLMKPSWFASLPDAKRGLSLLDELYGLQTLRFTVGGVLPMNVYWVPPHQILKQTKHVCAAQRIIAVDGGWEVSIRGDGKPMEPLTARKVIVAAGIWSELLVPQIGKQKGWHGMSFLWPARKVDHPFIKPWAPYKQLVGFNRGDGAWVGDGAAILNWNAEHEEASYTRCQAPVGFPEPPQRMLGIRPYHPNAKTGVLKQVKPGLWVVTGGAKNGTITAACLAARLCRQI